jgi:hypothetical protein
MKTLFRDCKCGSLFFLLFLSTNSISQSVTTTGYPVIYYSGNPTIPVDPSLTITSSVTITDVRVRISQNLHAGDVLNYTGSLPAGVSSTYNTTYGEWFFSGTASASDWQAFLRTVTFHTTSTIIDDRTITFSIGNLVAGPNGHFYEYVPFGSAANILTWMQAKDTAAARTYHGWHGYLATITSQAENDIIFQRLSASGWIGSSDDHIQINLATGTTTYNNQNAAEGKWYWVTGPEAGTQFSESAWPGATPTPVNGMYLNWSANEPNNNWNTVQGGVMGEQYGEIYSGTSPWGQPGKWNDFYNLNSDMDFVQGYVVEYGNMPTDTSLTLAANRTIIFNGSLLSASGSFQRDPAANRGARYITWSCFPNPVPHGNTIQLKIAVPNTRLVHVIIYTITGQQERVIPLMVQAGSQSQTLFINDLPAGTYLLGMLGQDGKYIGQLQKLIVQ